MNISGASATSGADLASQVSIRMVKKTMDVAKQQGAAAVELIRQAGSVQSGSGGGGGGGGRLDVVG